MCIPWSSGGIVSLVYCTALESFLYSISRGESRNFQKGVAGACDCKILAQNRELELYVYSQLPRWLH